MEKLPVTKSRWNINSDYATPPPPQMFKMDEARQEAKRELIAVLERHDCWRRVLKDVQRDTYVTRLDEGFFQADVRSAFSELDFSYPDYFSIEKDYHLLLSGLSARYFGV